MSVILHYVVLYQLLFGSVEPSEYTEGVSSRRAKTLDLLLSWFHDFFGFLGFRI